MKHFYAINFIILLLWPAARISFGQYGGQGAGEPANPQLPAFETRYYIMHTDIDAADRQEAEIRMTRMAEEYHNRTRDFSGVIREKLPFYLFRHADDYHAAGGLPGSAGVFDGEKLMAIAGEKTTARTWHVVQHEGFHQFAQAVIGGDLPIWVNEGLAEFFGESLFTGDGFVTGVIPPWRMQRVQKTIEAKAFKPVPEMMLLSHEQWNADMSPTHYDQAWSMVHFLAYAENGRYQKAFAGFMNGISRGRPWKNAWQENFGDAVGFEERWRAYWTTLPENPTAELYAKAATATLTSFLARAVSQKQSFDSFEDFIKAAEAGELRAHPNDWLPPGLLQGAIKTVRKNGGQWSIVPGAKNLPRIVFLMEDQARLTGTFTLRGDQVDKVSVAVDHSGQGNRILIPPVI